MGVRMLIVGGAMCLYRCFGIVYNWDFGIGGVKIFFFLWLPMYCAYLNFRVWVICMLGTCLLFQKWLESVWLICSFDSHLLTYGNFLLADVFSRFSCSFVMNVWRFWMAPSCVVVGQLASQCGVVRAMRIRGVISGLSFCVPSFASVFAISFPLMPVCARTLCMWIICGVQYIWWIMTAISSLSGWCCWDVGCCMWLLIKYMLLRLLVNICVSLRVVWILLMAMSIAFSLALRMFWYPGSLYEIWVMLLEL